MEWGSKTFVIAEIGSNHNQDIERAFELIDKAKEIGADAVKFQSINLNKLIDKNDITVGDRELFRQIELNEAWYEKLFSYAKRREIECISAPTYLESIPLLVEQGVKYIKIASPQTWGFPELIKKVAQTGLKTIMSTGYCEDIEIERAVDKFLQYGNKDNLILLHCISQYPTKLANVNLCYIKKLQEKYCVPVGFSDHTEGIALAGAAVALGASVIEKHITISKTEKGPDHFFALEVEEFAEMIRQIREIEIALGNGKKQLTTFEIEQRDSLVMYPYTKERLEAGQVVTGEDVKFYRSKGKGISPWEMEENLIGKKVSLSMDANTKFQYENLEK